MTAVRTIEDLERIYGPLGAVGEASTAKVADHVTPQYRRFIDAAPFVALATSGPEGLDCSPRGDKPGFVRVQDPRTLLLPDRRGNNRIDSLRNVVRDPRVGLMFLIPGIGNAMRVNGRAFLDADPGQLASFAVDGKAPRTVMVVEVGEVYLQCARALVRSRADPGGDERRPRGWRRVRPQLGRTGAADDVVTGEGETGKSHARRGDGGPRQRGSRLPLHLGLCKLIYLPGRGRWITCYPGSPPEGSPCGGPFAFPGLILSPRGITENSSALGLGWVHSKIARSLTLLPYPSSRSAALSMAVIWD